MRTRTEKAEIVRGLTERFEKSTLSIFADIHGISVAKLSALRRELKKLGAELKVAKKTLLKRALDSVGTALDPEALEGEVGVIFGYEDPVAPAKALAKFRKENEAFRVLKGIFGGKILEAAAVAELARLPAREDLLAKLVWVLKSPLQGLANVLKGNTRNLVVVLNQISNKK